MRSLCVGFGWPCHTMRDYWRETDSESEPYDVRGFARPPRHLESGHKDISVPNDAFWLHGTMGNGRRDFHFDRFGMAWRGVAWHSRGAARRGARLETSVPQISLFSAKALLPTLLLYPGAPLFGYPLYPSHQSTPRLDTLLAEYSICRDDEIH